jgi:hypothetical protein
MTTIPASLRRLVIQRADNRCEYCRISQIGQVATFHIDHIVPVVAGGETIAKNLALACVSCKLALTEVAVLKLAGNERAIAFPHPPRCVKRRYPVGNRIQQLQQQIDTSLFLESVQNQLTSPL